MTSIEHLVRKHYPSLPNGWKMRKLKFIAQARTSNVDKIISDAETPVSLCNYIDVYYNDTITPDLTFMQGSATEAEIERFELRRDQVIVTKDSESWDDIAIPSYVPEDMPGVVCGYHLAVLTPDREHLSGRYLSWLCRTENLNGQFKVSANGVTRYGLGHHAIKNALVSFPPVADQERIADYLDERTARIDGLIARKERLLDLLAEKRQALITRAVTKGLDADAGKRDRRVVKGVGGMSDLSPSMFRRFGDGWAMRRLKYLATLNDEVLPENTDPSMEIEYIEIADVSLTGGVERNAVMEFDEAPSRARRRVRGGDVLVSTVRTYLKAIAAVPKASKNLVASTGFCVVRPGSDVEPRYMGWVAKSEPFVSEIVSRSVGVSYPAINQSEVGSLAVPLPDWKTQERIADYLDERTVQIDGLIVKNERFLELLGEYRSALITAAVTGQLDVMEEAA